MARFNTKVSIVSKKADDVADGRATAAEISDVGSEEQVQIGVRSNCVDSY